MKYVFSEKAKRAFARLEKNNKERIFKKLDFFFAQDNPCLFAKTLTNFEKGKHRFRVGDYRVVFDIVEDAAYILWIDHRKDVYR